MNLYIRADANSIIGIGHIMRCLALGQTWNDQGGRVTFITHCENEHLKQIIKDEGFDLFLLPCTCPDPNDQKSTIKIIKNKYKNNHNDWFVLDGYHFTSEYQKAIRETGIYLLILDDINHLDHYYADIILNQNSNAHTLHYKCNKDTKMLMGTNYIFLRREFLNYRDFTRDIHKQSKKLLITLGGSDPDNLTSKTIRALQLLNKLHIEITVVVGPTNIHRGELQSLLEAVKLRFKLLVNPSDMVGLMADSELAICGGGGTCWELLYMRVPCIMIILAENQRNVAEELAKSGIVCNLGWHDLVSEEKIAKNVQYLIMNGTLRHDMINKGKAICDGNGAGLTVDAMKSFKRNGRKTQ